MDREEELDLLHQWAETAHHGRRQVGLITGEAGIGKTALVRAFVAHWDNNPTVLVAYGQCVEQYGSSEPYLPLLEAVGRLCREGHREEVVAVLSQVAPSWLAQLPAVLSSDALETLAHAASGVTPARMMREFADAVEVLTASHMLILVLEDLHWSDTATLELLHYVARRLDPAKLLVLGTYRLVEVVIQNHPLHQMRAELHRLPQCRELVLDYLSEAAMKAYLSRRFGALPQLVNLTQILYQRTNGNPLFMLAVTDELVRSKLLQWLHGAWRLSGGFEAISAVLPASLQTLIEHDIEQLSCDDQALLEAASVAGVDFAAAAVASCLAQAAEQVEARFAVFARQGRFIQASGYAAWSDGTVTACYRFRHALYQELLYQRLPAGRQTRLHAQIAMRLARGFSDQAGEMATAVAWHCVQGHQLATAIPYLSQAGCQAAQRGANQEAVAFYEQALAILEQLPATPDYLAQAIDLHLDLEESLFALGHFERVYQTLQAAACLAEPLGDQRRQGEIQLGLSVSFRRLGAYREAVSAAQRAEKLATAARHHALQAWAALRLGQAAYFLGDYTRAGDCFRRATAVPTAQIESENILTTLPSHARSWLVYCLAQRGEFREGRLLGSESVRIAETGAFATSQCAGLCQPRLPLSGPRGHPVRHCIP